METGKIPGVKILTAGNKYLVVQLFFDPAIQTPSHPVIKPVVGHTTKS